MTSFQLPTNYRWFCDIQSDLAQHVIFFSYILLGLTISSVRRKKKSVFCSENQSVQHFNLSEHTLSKFHQAANEKMRDTILSSLSFKCYLVITVTTDGSSNNAYILVTYNSPQ